MKPLDHSVPVVSLGLQTEELRSVTQALHAHVVEPPTKTGDTKVLVCLTGNTSHILSHVGAARIEHCLCSWNRRVGQETGSFCLVSPGVHPIYLFPLLISVCFLSLY